MRFCDLTMAYNVSSGGIRTYIDEKRRYFSNTPIMNIFLIVPGADDRIEREGRTTTIYIESPLLPNQDTYRYFRRPDKIRDLLVEHQPEIIELGSYYLCPWAAFAYREILQENGQTCLIGCYFHTDVAEAYVGAPLRAIAHDWLGDWSESLATGRKTRISGCKRSRKVYRCSLRALRSRHGAIGGPGCPTARVRGRAGADRASGR
jgi:alpha-1,6-mannosyltransferase